MPPESQDRTHSARQLQTGTPINSSCRQLDLSQPYPRQTQTARMDSQVSTARLSLADQSARWAQQTQTARLRQSESDCLNQTAMGKPGQPGSTETGQFVHRRQKKSFFRGSEHAKCVRQGQVGRFRQPDVLS